MAKRKSLKDYSECPHCGACPEYLAQEERGEPIECGACGWSDDLERERRTA